MQLPKYKKKVREKLKICQEPGCGKEFVGHVIAKYCEVHRDITNRKRNRRKYEKPDVKNRVILHKGGETQDRIYACALEGCDKEFNIKVFPKLGVYPKYCEEHRNECRRESFLRKQKLKTVEV